MKKSINQVWGKYERNGKFVGMWAEGKGSVERCVGGNVFGVWGEELEVCWGSGEVWENRGRCGNVGEVCGSVFGVWGGVGNCVWV